MEFKKKIIEHSSRMKTLTKTNQIFLPDGECGEDEPCRVGQCRNPDDDLPGCGMEDDAGAVAGEV